MHSLLGGQNSSGLGHRIKDKLIMNQVNWTHAICNMMLPKLT